jgi:hypothetical protein
MQYLTTFDVIFAAICRDLPRIATFLSFYFFFYCLFVDIFDPHHKSCV